MKSIGSNTFRANGTIAECVGPSSAFRCSNVMNSNPFTASIVIRCGNVRFHPRGSVAP